MTWQMRALGIDFGEKRIGIALSDPDGRYALPHSTLARKSDATAIAELARLAALEAVGWIAVGEPRRADGSAGTAAERVRRFAARLAEATGLPVELVDEALTSREAAERLTSSGLPAKRQKRKLDAVAAQLVLQEALDRRNAGAR